MKKRTLLAMAAILAILAIVFCACGKKTGDGGKKDGTETDKSAEKVKVAVIDNISDYKIVRSDSAGETEKTAVSNLRDAFAAVGADVKLGTDFGSKGEYEFLVGETKRTESRDALGLLASDFDYVIKKTDTKVVIVGKTSEATLEAVDFYIKNFIVDDKITAPTGDGYSYICEIKAKDVKIDGKDISEYRFLYLPDISNQSLKGNYDEVSALAEKLSKEYIGKSFEVTQNALAGYNIILDASLLDYTKGSIYVENGDLYLKCSYHSMNAVIEKFFSMLSDGANITGKTEIDTADAPNPYTKEELYKVLEKVYNDNGKLIVGDEINSSREMPSKFFAYYTNGDLESGGIRTGTGGAMPSIVGGDLGRCGMMLPTLPEEYKHMESRYICELIDYAKEGGIITLGCHMTNPTGNFGGGSVDIGSIDRGSIGGEDAWRDLVTEGTEINKVFKSELALDAELLAAFRDAGVPIIWRPFHEMNGGWFWFHPFDNGKLLDASVFVEMWKYVYNYFTDECGLDNLLWEYSPNNMNGGTDVMYCYPGDEYVDLVGLDWYTAGGYEVDGSGKSYEKIMETGKIASLAEIGINESLKAENIEEQKRLFTAQDLIGLAETMMREDYMIAYFMTYNAYHSLAYLPGGDEVMKSELVLDLSEMKALFESVR